MNRWGHTATLYDGKLMVFGGYGGTGAHSRSADVLVYDCTTNVLSSPPIQGPCPAARMGHSAVLFGHTLVIFGGRLSPAQPLSDVWALDLLALTWRCIACKGDAPAARFRHTAVACTSPAQSETMIVHGGYDGQHTFSDTYILDMSDWTWQQASTTGWAAQPCHSHAAALLHHRMFVFGGTQGYRQSCPALRVLDLKTHEWERVRLPQAAPQADPLPCFSHSLTAVGGLLVLAGGCHTLGAGHVHVFDPSLKRWSRHTVADSSGLVLCRHTATALPQHPPSILFLGGGMNCFGFGTTFSPPVLLDLTPLTSQHIAGIADTHPTQQASDNIPCGQKADNTLTAADAATHQASDVTANGLITGKTSISGLSAEEGIELTHHAATTVRGILTPGGVSRRTDLPEGACGVGVAPAANCKTAEGRLPGKQSSLQPAGKGHAKAHTPGNQGLAVSQLQAKAAKDALKRLGWLDQAYKAQPDPTTNVICLPLTQSGSAILGSAQLNPAAEIHHADGDAAVQFVLKCTSDAAASMVGWVPVPTGEVPVMKGSSARPKGSTAGGKGKKQKPVGSQEGDRASLLGLMHAGLAAVQPMEAQVSARVQGGPAQRMRGAVTHLLQQQHLTQEHIRQLLLELPSRWEKLGDLALLPRTSMTSLEWGCLAQPLWEAIANALGVRRLAMQAPVADAGTRDSQAQLVLGASGWVQHKEGGVLYSLDVTKCMFSSGNTTERQRMGRLHCTGETILDLYAGIGYYTLPFLCKSGAAKVIACEWNPNAVQALRRNLELNRVADRCHVLEGDCRLTAPKGIADRVCLGLLPSSQGGWRTALEALKPDEGGWLHLHHNVTDSSEAKWCQQTISALQSMATHALNNSWVCRLVHCERVKWYAPHVRHLVLDIHMQPSHSSA